MRVDWCVSSWFRIKNSLSLSLVKDVFSPFYLPTVLSRGSRGGYPLAASGLVSLFVSVRACRHHLSSVHPYRVDVQSEPGCSSPSYLT